MATVTQDPLNEKPAASWGLVALVYGGILLSFACIILYRISTARDPFVGSLRIPDSGLLQGGAALVAAVSGITSLFTCGVIVDRGSTNQMLALVLVLPLILILLDAVALID